ncbi:hypothetical protein DFH07DRAFT_945752 [Mycena maculata]|uniref:Indoleamine 2,3-dioxygenase n=1 Tax=Mycena maculata TaxID=230809 RepID=A0AAD7HW21_9AGAR|nr:hypothetical protein DFH07DRAFT_945752 [Mycena maculata]
MFSWIFPASIQSTNIHCPSIEILHDPLKHRALECLRDLIQIGGGGTWPPTATYDESWPLPLRAYNAIIRTMEPLLPVEEPSMDDTRNRRIIASFRARLRSELDRCVEMKEVESTLERWQSESDCSAQSAWLGFFACISFLRHSYRWGVTPIVREAQNEEFVAFPNQLDIPWTALQRHFGTTSPSGCMTSICYSNIVADTHLQYSVTVGMPEVIRSTEFWNTKLVFDMEAKILPAYQKFAQAMAFIDFGRPAAARDALKSASDILKMALKYFFSTMVDSNMSHAVWMAYVQGFQGWALDGLDGISGGQSLIFRTLDAFLGIRPWPTPEKERLHIPEAQRNWLEYLRDYDIRAVAKEKGYYEVTAELDSLVKQLRLWRMGHMRRMQPYESVRRPERKTMTAGISVVDAPDEASMIEHLKKELGHRLAQTV